jgi:nicotinate-nucleotide adenylyltransferase
MESRKTIGLYFGTFNPIHIGHLNIAHYFAHHSDLDEVWLVVTPQNPLKNKKSLLADYHRAALVDIAVEDYPRLKTCRVEFDMPQPNYTVNTLAVLQEQNPNLSFALIMGQDNLDHLHKWKNYQWILQHIPILVYPRVTGSNGQSNGDDQTQFSGKITKVKAPIFELSSTFIRKNIKIGADIRPMLPENVWRYIDEMNFYK